MKGEHEKHWRCWASKMRMFFFSTILSTNDTIHPHIATLLWGLRLPKFNAQIDGESSFERFRQWVLGRFLAWEFGPVTLARVTSVCAVVAKATWNLVGGLVAIFGIFPSIGNVIIPIDFPIFQSGSNHQPEIIFTFCKERKHEDVACIWFTVQWNKRVIFFVY